MRQTCKLFAALLLGSLLAHACAPQEIEAPVGIVKHATVYATAESATGTKTYADNQLHILWNAGDQISVFDNTVDNLCYSYDGADGAAKAEFTLASGTPSGSAISHGYAVYPYMTTNSVSSAGELGVTIPSDQAYADGSFASGSNVMVSVSDDHSFNFKNVGGILVIKLYGDGVTVNSVELKGNHDEPLAGEATVTIEPGMDPSTVLSSTASKAILLTCSTPVDLPATGYKEFWFVVPPTSFTGGFTVTVNATDGTFTKSTSNPVTIDRNTIKRMEPAEVVIAQPNDEIWYTTYSGTAVTPYNPSGFNASIVSNTYTDGKGVIKFDADLSTIQAWTFYGTDLKTVQLPASVTTIKGYAFAYCYSLETINIPEGLTSFSNDVSYHTYSPFINCRRLKSFTGKYVTADGRAIVKDGTMYGFAPAGLTEYTVDGSVTDLCCGVMSSAYNLTNIYLPSGLRIIGGQAFEYCSSLQSITLPTTVELIGPYAFRGCAGLTTIHIPDSVTSLAACDQSSFSRCYNLASFTGKFASADGHYLSSSPDVIDAFALAGVTDYVIPEGVACVAPILDAYSLRTIDYPSTVTMFGQICDCPELTSITVRAATPPSNLIQEDYYDSSAWLLENTNNCPIYVPEASLEAYKNASQWNYYESRIQGFSGGAVAVPTDEIWYTSATGDVIDVSSAEFGANVVSNTYADGKGVIKCDGPVTEIGMYAFMGAPLLTIDLPSSVAVIRSSAFAECELLETFQVPSSAEFVEPEAFKGCTGMTSFTGPYATSDHRALIVYGQTLQAFAPAGITTYTVPDGVLDIGPYVFAGSGLTSVTLPDGLRRISYFAFMNCTDLESIILPDSLQTLEPYAFSGCISMTSAYVPDGVTLNTFNTDPYGRWFDECTSLQSFTGSHAAVGGHCLVFDNRVLGVALAGVTDLTIPEGIEMVCPIQKFNELKTVSLPSTITICPQIVYCHGLQSIKLAATTVPTSFARNWYSNTDWLFWDTNNCPIYVPSASVGAYEASDVFGYYVGRIVGF